MVCCRIGLEPKPDVNQNGGLSSSMFHRHLLRFFAKMPDTFILIPGRTSKQGVGINEGKYGETYQGEINNLQVAGEDMERLGLNDGDRVRLTGEHGQIEVAVKTAKKGELPAGLLFIAYGDLSSQMMGGDTHGSGMPTSKGMDVTMEKVDR